MKKSNNKKEDDIEFCKRTCFSEQYINCIKKEHSVKLSECKQQKKK